MKCRKKNKKILDEMEWTRIGRERYKEKFILRSDFNPDDEDLDDIKYSNQGMQIIKEP